MDKSKNTFGHKKLPNDKLYLHCGTFLNFYVISFVGGGLAAHF